MRLTFPGGLSCFSARKGFACDNVKNFEVVLANGQIVNANAEENSDLWLALKGGSNNFGIVTRFDLLAFKQDYFWGGIRVWDEHASLQLLSAFADFNVASFDEYAALVLSFSFDSEIGFYVSGNIQNTQPIENPPTFQPFTSIGHQRVNTMRISDTADFVTEFVELNPFENSDENPNGNRYVFTFADHRNNS